MMTLDEFDAPRLDKAPTAHAITMISGASIQYLIYAVPAWQAVKSQFPYYLALINNRDNSLITTIGMRDYAWAIKRASNMALENIGSREKV